MGSRSMTDPMIGSTLAGRYRLDALLGQGGMGSVWRAHHLTLNSPVAIKLIDPAIAATAEGPERFVREAQAAAALRSPHVVQTFDYGIHEGIPFIAMELLDGENLADRLERSGPLTPAETAKLLTHVGRAVGKAHDMGIVHRDLKPDNVFIVVNDDEEVAKVLDFGIAKLTHGPGAASSRTRTGAVMGTAYYMSPEQAEGAVAVDHRTDIWALGVIAYECLLGVRPFDGEGIGELILRICTRPIPVPSAQGAVPRGFDEWFARACSRDRDQRFGSVRELTDALRALITSLDPDDRERITTPDLEPGRRVHSSTTAPFGRTQPEDAPRRTPAILFLGGGLLALVLASVGIYFGVGSQELAAPASASAVLAAPLPPASTPAVAAPATSTTASPAAPLPSASSARSTATLLPTPPPKPKPKPTARAKPTAQPRPVKATPPIKEPAPTPPRPPTTHGVAEDPGAFGF